MRRPLDDTEREVDTKQLSAKKRDMAKLKRNLEYNNALLDRQEYQRKFDDDWKVYLREGKDIEDQEVVKLITEQIDNVQSHIDELEDHLANGVDIKQIS